MRELPQLRKRTNLFVPIETKVRELHGKVLFSMFAANAGFKVVVGEQRILREVLPFQLPGIYVDKSVAQSKDKWFKRFKSLGNTIVAWDEEGLIFHDGSYVEKRFSRAAFNQVDRFYAWGKHHEDEILHSLNHIDNKIKLSGNPRFDMLRPELRSFYSNYIKEIKSRYGRFVLINTNFGHVNHFAGQGYKEKIRKKGRGPGMVAFIKEWREFQEKIFIAFADAMKVLAVNIDQVQFVIRPHPSENHSFWEEMTSEFANVHVVHEGNVIEWILASECVIHNDCTTAVESYLLDVPVIAFRPEQSEKYETYLPNALSDSVRSVAELVNSVEKVIEHVSASNVSLVDSKSNKKTVADNYISSIQSDFASQVIVKDLVALADGKFQDQLKLRCLLSLPFRVYYYALILYRRFEQKHRGDKYLKHKFKELDIDEFEGVVNLLTGIYPEFKNFEIKKVAKSCFSISKPVNETR